MKPAADGPPVFLRPLGRRLSSIDIIPSSYDR